ncbi:MAG: OmpH family outer membrane protein [Planctomycetes bacterium]|nr:OmpH family outer membrane protein [Planctomycetota bacterium]
MKPVAYAVLVLIACAAGIAGSLLHESFKSADAVQPAYAVAPPRQDKSIRIALVNLEEASRQSRVFKKLKVDWDDAQKELKAQGEKYQQAYEKKYQDIQRARMAGGDEDEILTLRVELQALEQTMKAAEEEGKKYLSALLSQFQKDVLIVVMDEIDKFCRLEGYDIVLQDYSLDNEEADFFAGNAYAQALMSKPVLMAPGMQQNKNAYVVDITQAIIERVKGG